MKTHFADTFYFLALLNPSDRAHGKAAAFTSANADRILTTDWVLTELADGLARIHHQLFIPALSVVTGSIRIVNVLSAICTLVIFTGRLRSWLFTGTFMNTTGSAASP